ncbi:RNA polymerase sigma factor [Kitasatospora sp. NBC_00240]|uniref:RNA polymerase sigma factor n=1 Tax=Kitasatospora sp. NBC_00240 TaxID=2903567 RepID=UPI002259B5D3|nr:RNA polymerase sigma factor [Kitasatospora sp. NBC_00240]MCX5210021.1 RNA polymerase sigma factor [Kitasatospora sp. NBC_00240]
MTGTAARPQLDPALVRAAQRGDPIALGDLMDLLAPYVGRICGPIALQDGPDAAQEALIVVLRSIGQLRDHAALFGWVRAIAVREAVRVAVRAKRLSGDPVEEVAGGADQQLATDVGDVLARLTAEHRAVLVLRDLEGVDEATASAVLAVPPGTVRSRLHRARQSFRKVWES